MESYNRARAQLENVGARTRDERAAARAGRAEAGAAMPTTPAPMPQNQQAGVLNLNLMSPGPPRSPWMRT